VYRVAELRGISREKMEEIRDKKAEERGGFVENLFLIKTYSNSN
jgi:predicted house-cleaning noncanonical NTP pyrophosphatase (MazG superfamily)